MIIYVAILILVCLRIIFETHSTNKTLAYLLFCLFIPVLGILFYLAFGINYWRKKRYGKKEVQDNKILDQLRSCITEYDKVSINAIDKSDDQNTELASMLIKDLGSPLTGNNRVELLVNGEQKFPVLMKAIAEATHHIHIEYYIY